MKSPGPHVKNHKPCLDTWRSLGTRSVNIQAPHPSASPACISRPASPPPCSGHTQKSIISGDVWEIPKTDWHMRSSREFCPWMSSHKNLNADGGHIALHWGELSSCWQEAWHWQALKRRRRALPAGDRHLAEDQTPHQLIQPRAGFKHISPWYNARTCPVHYWKNRAKEIHPEANQFQGNEGVTPHFASLGRSPLQNITEAGQNLGWAYVYRV